MQGRAEERRGLALHHFGRTEEAREALEGAIRLLEGAGEIWVLSVVTNLGESRRVAGDLGGALRLNGRALELAVRIGAVTQEMSRHLRLAQTLLASGEWKSAREHVARAEEIGRTRGTAA